MKKIIVTVLVLFFLIWQAGIVKASAISSPDCLVKAQVINAGCQKSKLDTGKEDESCFIDLKILEITKKEDCTIEKGQVYRLIDNHPGLLKINDIVSSGISFSSSMGPNGPVNFLQWSQLAYENGLAIKHQNKEVINYLQSSQAPLRSESQ